MGEPQRILISGASGFIGAEVTTQLEADGHSVIKLVRREAENDAEVRWAPGSYLDPGVMDTVDAVINLSGASTGRLPWTHGYKLEILRSRADAATTLAEAINAASTPPAVLLNASAVGYFGDRPGEELTEESSKGDGFLSDVVQAWELAPRLAAESTRVVSFRTGLVVGDGGAFGPLGLLTRFGLGARLGRGTQVWPWIALSDEAAAIRHLLGSSLSGPVNLAGPVAATSVQITKALATAFHRPHLLAVPEFVIRGALGDAGEALLLSDQHIIPQKLVDDGFVFEHTTVETAIAAIWPEKQK